MRGQDININYTLMADLIDANSTTWKLDVLNKLFDSEQVNRIVSIPLSRFARMDKLVWRGIILELIRPRMATSGSWHKTMIQQQKIQQIKIQC